MPYRLGGAASADRYRYFRIGVILLAVVLATGVAGLVLIEGYSPLEALWMTLITLSTVGYGEVRVLSPLGRVFVMALIVFGLGVVTYTMGTLGGIVIEGQFRKILGRRLMRKEIGTLKGHFIICGHGRMGEIVCRELAAERRPFVLIESDPEQGERLCEAGTLVVAGDATEDETLLEAGVERARALVSVVSSDVDNLYITLSARELTRKVNPGLYILSRAADGKAAAKIRHAGADRVLSPYQIGGSRLVQALIKPHVFDFMEVLSQGEDERLQVEELPIGEHCLLAGKAIRDSGLRKEYDLIIIGLLKKEGGMVFNPGPDEALAAGDLLITLGRREQLNRLSAEMKICI